MAQEETAFEGVTKIAYGINYYDLISTGAEVSISCVELIFEKFNSALYKHYYYCLQAPLRAPDQVQFEENSWADRLFGAFGDDVLIGTSGDDLLVGGDGNFINDANLGKTAWHSS